MVRFVQTAQHISDGNVLSQIEGSCLKADTKPTAGIANGSIMVEVDTGKVFFFNEGAGTWVEQFSFQS